MKTSIKRCLMFAYSRGVLSPAIVAAVFAWLDLARH